MHIYACIQYAWVCIRDKIPAKQQAWTGRHQVGCVVSGCGCAGVEGFVDVWSRVCCAHVWLIRELLHICISIYVVVHILYVCMYIYIQQPPYISMSIYMYICSQQLTCICISIYLYLDTTIRYTYIIEYVIYTHTNIHHIHVMFTAYIRDIYVRYIKSTIHV